MSEEKKIKKGKLFIVSTPIGNSDDITSRAKKVLGLSDYVVCEEFKIGARLLSGLNLKKELLSVNEQNESRNVNEIIELLKKGKFISLISDAGTPIFADPGAKVLKAALANEIDIEVIPGASSIMTALVRSGFSLHQFLYAGFLSRIPDERLKEIKELANEYRTIVILETPYRLLPVLEAFTKVMPKRKAYIGMNLTMPFETHHYGTFEELYAKFSENKVKAEFVIVFEGLRRKEYKLNSAKNQGRKRMPRK